MNFSMPKIADLLAASKAAGDPEAELAGLLGGMDRLSETQAAARKELQLIEMARPALLLGEDDSGLDKLDKRAKAAERTIAMADLATPRLQARVKAIREDVIHVKAERHVAAALVAQAAVDKALDALAIANAAADRAHEKARVDFGAGIDADLYVPRATFSIAATKDAVAHWRKWFSEFRDGPPPKPEREPGFICQVLRHWDGYRPGDLVYLPDELARLQVQAGMAEFTDPVAVPPSTDPRRAAMPEPIEGRVIVMFLRPCSIGPSHPDTGGYRPGDIVGLQDFRNAEQLVRNGFAEWVNNEAA